MSVIAVLQKCIWEVTNFLQHCYVYTTASSLHRTMHISEVIFDNFRSSRKELLRNKLPGWR